MPHQTQFKIHISDVQRFKGCRQSWSWASPTRANLTPRDKYMPFWLGSLIHHCLEMRYTRDMPINLALASYPQLDRPLDEITDQRQLENLALAQGLMQHYALWQKHDHTWLADDMFDFIASERDFAMPLWANSRNRIDVVGTFDGVVQSKHNGKYYLWEIKTTRSIIEREKQLALDSQTDTYLNVAQREIGIELAGVVYTLIRKKIPEFPKVLKSGMLSQAKDQDTSAEWFLRNVKIHHGIANWTESPKAWIHENYGEIIDHFARQGNPYFSRVVVNRSQADLADAWDQLQAVAREMVNPRTPIYRNESYACNYCLFRHPCITKRAGGDYDAILARDYVFNDRYADEIPE